MARPGFMDRGFNVAGYGMPMAAALLGGMTVAATVITMVGLQARSAMGGVFMLVPALVLQGQVWRLVTWAFVEPNLLGLVFGVAAQVLWVGPDLCRRWGWRRFLGIYLGFAAITGAILCGLSLVIPGLANFPFATIWAVLSALFVAWGLSNQGARILFMFAVPASGEQIVWLTGAMIVLGAVFSGPVTMLPEFICFLLALAYFKQLQMLWYRLRLKMNAGSGRKRRPSHLRPVDSDERPRWYH